MASVPWGLASGEVASRPPVVVVAEARPWEVQVGRQRVEAVEKRQ